MSLLGWLALIAAGALGAPARYVIDTAIQERARGAYPWGTFVVNVSGSFLLGLLTGLALYHAFPDTPKAVLGSGFLGAYTTFSTFTFETVRLAEEGASTDAVRNVLGTVAVAAAAAAAGLALAAL